MVTKGPESRSNACRNPDLRKSLKSGEPFLALLKEGPDVCPYVRRIRVNGREVWAVLEDDDVNDDGWAMD